MVVSVVLLLAAKGVSAYVPLAYKFAVDALTAATRGYAAVFGTVQRHAAMLSFVDLFQIYGPPTGGK